MAAPPTCDEDLDLVLETAALLHANGQSTAMTLIAVDRLNRRLGMATTVIPSWDSVTIHTAGALDPVRIKAVRPTAVNMRLVAAVMRAVDGEDGDVVERRALRRALDEARRSRRVPSTAFCLACALAAAALSLVYGATNWSIVGTVAVVGGVGGALRRSLERFRVGVLGQSFAAALLAGLAGVVATRVDPQAGLGLVTICPAMILVPGPHLLMGAMDLLGLRVALGMSRLGYAALVLSSIAAGLIVGLGIGGQTLHLAAPIPHDSLGFDVLGAAVAASCFPVFFAMPYRFIGFPVVVGTVAHTLHWWALAHAHASLAISALLSCAFVGAVLVSVAYSLRFPFAAVAFAAVVALVPGVYVFRALDGLSRLSTSASVDLLVQTASDGATALVVLTCMAVGLTVPARVRDTLLTRRWHADEKLPPRA